MDKVRVIEGSRRCLYFGLAAHIPYIGLPFVVLALMQARRVNKDTGDGWNPVRGRLFCGRGLAFLALLIQLVVIPILCYFAQSDY